MSTDTVTNIMSAPVVSLRPGMKLSEVRHIFAESNFHHLPVAAESGTVVGIVSTTDLIGLSFEAYGATRDVMDEVIDKQFKLTEIMRAPVVVHRTDSVRRAAELLSSGDFHCLPVVDDTGRLHGIVTSTDLINYLLAQLAG